MSKIRVDVDYPIYDGQSLTFNAPCDCTAADGLRVYYPGGNKTFIFCDAHNRNIYGIGNVFSEGALVKVVLDVTNERAYLQNADYNTYIDGLIRKYGQVKYGTYEGTGDTVASLDFGFEPGLLIVGSNLDYNYLTDQSKQHPSNHFVWIYGQSSTLVNVIHEQNRIGSSYVDSHIRLAFTATGNTVSWIGYRHAVGSSTETETAYFNNAGETYYYLAIGKNDALGPDIEPGGGGEVVATTAVLYTPQSLTEAQKAQARKNIGIPDTGGGGGSDGITPHIGENGNWYTGTTDTGVKAKGEDGRGIVSVQHTSTSGLYDTYTITYTDKTTSTFTVKNGSDGTSVTVESVRMSAENGGTNIVEFSDGNKLNVKNGYSPVRGVDYDTPEDRAEIEAYIATELAKRGQLKPEFAQTVADCTDTSKLYVLPDGMIWAYMYTEVGVGGYTNLIDTADAEFKTKSRINDANAVTSATNANAFVSNIIAAKSRQIIRIKGVTGDTSGATTPQFKILFLLEDGEPIQSVRLGGGGTGVYFVHDLVEISDDGVYKYQLGALANGTVSGYDNTLAKIRVSGIATNGFDNIIITLDEEIIEPEIIKEYQWASTGHAFVPADYEGRIVDLEAEDVKIRQEIVTAKAETDEAIADLQEQIDSGSASAKSGARWFALGDSITEGYASVVDETAANGYRYFVTEAANRWVNIVAEKNGYVLTNHGIGGTGYLQSTQNARALADTIDFSQCDFVTLAYGVNDWKYAVNIGSMADDIATGGSMVANMRYVIKKILTDNPFCKIFVITPINCRSYGTYDTNWGINYKGGTGGHLNSLGLQDIFDRMKEVCDYHGVELIDMTHSSVVNRENIKTVLADYIHPTVECHKAMARELAKKIAFQ